MEDEAEHYSTFFFLYRIECEKCEKVLAEPKRTN